jgi:protein AATF/BFR2
MAPGKPRSGRSLADQLADLEDPTPKGMCILIGLTHYLGGEPTWANIVADFDPEDIEHDVQSSDDEGAGKESDLNAGREHYQSVG